MQLRSSLMDVTIIAASVVLGLYLIVTRGGPTKSDKLAREKHVLVTFDRDAVESIHLSPGGADEVILRKIPRSDAPDAYYLGATGESTAEPAAVAELLSSLEFATFGRIVAPSDALDLGFESPALEARITAGPRVYRLLIGNAAKSPANSRYAQISGTNVETRLGTVPDSLASELKKTPPEFRGSLLLPYSRSQTSALTVKSTRGEVALRAASHGFLVAQEKADRALTDLLFFQMARTKVEVFLDYEKVEKLQALSRDLFTVQQLSAAEPSYTAHFGGTCPDDPALLLARRSSPEPIAGCVPQPILAALIRASDGLRSTTATGFQADEVDHVIVQDVSSAKKLDLLRKDAGFSLLSRGSSEVPSEAGADFLRALCERHLIRLGDLPGEATQRSDITLKGQLPRTAANRDQSGDAASQVSTEHLKVYALAPERLLVERSDGIVFEVPEDAQFAFRADDDWARPREILDLTPTDLQKVKSQHANGYQQEVERSLAEYVLLSANKTSADRTSAGKTSANKTSADRELADQTLSRLLFEELSKLTSARFLSPSLPRPVSPMMTVTWSYSESLGAKADDTLFVGARTRGGYLAWCTCTEGTFVLPLTTFSVLDTPLVDRSPVTIDVAKLLSLKVTARNETYLFERVGEEFKAAGGQATDHMVEPLRGALTGVRVLSAGEGATSRPRETPVLILSGQRETAPGQLEDFEISFGDVSAWKGSSARAVWAKGTSQIFYAEKSSLTELEALF